jgi:hypothetical protein
MFLELVGAALDIEGIRTKIVRKLSNHIYNKCYGFFDLNPSYLDGKDHKARRIQRAQGESISVSKHTRVH